MTMRIWLTMLVFLPSLVPFIVIAAPSFTVAPFIIDTKAQPRDIKTFDITLANTGTQPVTLYPTVNNISIDEGGAIQKFLPPVESDRTTSLASWLEISRIGIKLAKGDTKTVTLTLHVGPNAKPGSYHAFIGFGYGRNRDEAEEMVRNVHAQGAIINVTIDDNRSEVLKLSQFIIDRFVTSGTNQAATYKINNPGDEPLAPTGEIIFYNNRGTEVSSLPVNPDHETIDPGKEKEFKAEVPVEGLFGKYKAYLSVEYGPQLASVQDTEFFYVFPLKIILIILGIVCLFAGILAFFVHKRYIDEAMHDGSEHLFMNVRDTVSESKEHDINLKQQ